MQLAWKRYKGRPVRGPVGATSSLCMRVTSIWLIYHTADCVCWALVNLFETSRACIFQFYSRAYFGFNSALLRLSHACIVTWLTYVSSYSLLFRILQLHVQDMVMFSDYAICLIIKRVRRSRHTIVCQRPRKRCGAQIQEPLACRCQPLVSV